MLVVLRETVGCGGWGEGVGGLHGRGSDATVVEGEEID